MWRVLLEPNGGGGHPGPPPRRPNRRITPHGISGLVFFRKLWYFFYIIYCFCIVHGFLPLLCFFVKGTFAIRFAACRIVRDPPVNGSLLTIFHDTTAAPVFKIYFSQKRTLSDRKMLIFQLFPDSAYVFVHFLILYLLGIVFCEYF